MYQNSPFLQAFVCQEDVEIGDELLLNYGKAYWKAPWRGVPKSDAVSRCETGCYWEKKAASQNWKKWFEKCLAKVEGHVCFRCCWNIWILNLQFENWHGKVEIGPNATTLPCAPCSQPVRCCQDQSRKSFLVCKTRFLLLTTWLPAWLEQLAQTNEVPVCNTYIKNLCYTNPNKSKDCQICCQRSERNPSVLEHFFCLGRFLSPPLCVCVCVSHPSIWDHGSKKIGTKHRWNNQHQKHLKNCLDRRWSFHPFLLGKRQAYCQGPILSWLHWGHRLGTNGWSNLPVWFSFISRHWWLLTMAWHSEKIGIPKIPKLYLPLMLSWEMFVASPSCNSTYYPPGNWYISSRMGRFGKSSLSKVPGRHGVTRWWQLKYMFYFHPWARFPFWLLFFTWVETTK